jgi:hypothetical protein
MIALIVELNLHTFFTTNGIAFVTDDPHRAILARMRVGVTGPEMLSTLTVGVVLGMFTYGARARWLRLGRDAYMAHSAQMYDKLAARPLHLVIAIVAGILTALIFLVIFKGLALFYDVVSGPFAAKRKSTVPPARLIGDRSRPE